MLPSIIPSTTTTTTLETLISDSMASSAFLWSLPPSLASHTKRLPLLLDFSVCVWPGEGTRKGKCLTWTRIFVEWESEGVSICRTGILILAISFCRLHACTHTDHRVPCYSWVPVMCCFSGNLQQEGASRKKACSVWSYLRYDTII